MRACRDGWRCGYCFVACTDGAASATDPRVTVDHVYPRSCGGPDTADNLLSSCAPCNSLKANHWPTDLVWLRGVKPYGPPPVEMGEPRPCPFDRPEATTECDMGVINTKVLADAMHGSCVCSLEPSLEPYLLLLLLGPQVKSAKLMLEAGGLWEQLPGDLGDKLWIVRVAVIELDPLLSRSPEAAQLKIRRAGGWEGQGRTSAMASELEAEAEVEEPPLKVQRRGDV